MFRYFSNNYSDQLNELIDNDSDDEFEYYHKGKYKSK